MTSPEIVRTIALDAPPDRVWKVLTEPDLMARWMSDTPLDIAFAPAAGSQLIICGWLHEQPFVGTGVISEFTPCVLFEYKYHGSSILPVLENIPENQETIRFNLVPSLLGTELILTLSDFAHSAIPRHLAFYWAETLRIIKGFVEAEFPNIA